MARVFSPGLVRHLFLVFSVLAFGFWHKGGKIFIWEGYSLYNFLQKLLPEVTVREFWILCIWIRNIWNITISMGSGRRGEQLTEKERVDSSGFEKKQDATEAHLFSDCYPYNELWIILMCFLAHPSTALGN